MRSALRFAIGVTAVTALLTGCAGGGDPPRSAPAASTTATGSGETALVARSGAGVEAGDLSRVQVAQDVTVPGRPSDKLRLGVQSLSVQGKVMLLRLVVTPHFASQSNDKALSLFDALGDQVFRPRLVDGINLKEYSAIGGVDPWVSSELDVHAVNGSPMLAWAYFAAPQDNIRTVKVRISDAWPAFTDVRITR
jgi:hypothetical protein